VLTFSREFIEQAGYPVIYGDTDSLFVDLGAGGLAQVHEHGRRLSVRLNRRLREELRHRFQVESHLDIQVDKIFVRFFMPTIRGRDTGSKKRYAGLLVNDGGASELYFAGLESSRRDWTELAKEFQADLFALLFGQAETRDLKGALGALVRDRHRQLLDGRLDDKLVYHKGISKPLKAYTKNVPPHVRAARMLQRLEGRIVRYVMTTAGPEPVQNRSGAPYDYDHYSTKQLAPIADMVLRFFDLDYASLAGGGRQLNLFDLNDGFGSSDADPGF
jgi:DNA polymerase-2